MIQVLMINNLEELDTLINKYMYHSLSYTIPPRYPVPTIVLECNDEYHIRFLDRESVIACAVALQARFKW